jgi:hypothetical protein
MSSEVAVSISCRHLVIYVSLNLCLSIGTSILILTDAGKSHVSFRPVDVKICRTWDAQLFLPFSHSISCSSKIVLKIQFCVVISSFKKCRKQYQLF